MGLLADITEYFRRTPPNPRIVSKVVDAGLPNRPLAATHDWKKFAEEGYQRNVVIYACVKFWAATVSQVRLVAKQGDA